MNHKHDCKDCIYLGSSGTSDFYYCPRCDEGTLIARYGSEGYQYSSSPASLVKRTREQGWTDATVTPHVHVPGSDPRVQDEWPMSQAYKLALAKGLLSKDGL